MASPPLLTLQDIQLTFGSTPLFEGADLAVMPRDRICLVGRNGSGKSTLLKMADGQIEADGGDYFLKPGTTTRYLPQEPDLTGFATIRDYIEAGLEGSDDGYRIPYLLDALGLSGDEEPTHLSGGEIRRAALARTLAPEPDILMLDEPTNHLDLPAIEWLEGEVASMNSALLLISHDRRFLEKLSRKTVWVDRGVTHTMDKSFAHFEDWRDEFLEQEQLEHHKLKRQIHREQHWVVHGVSGRRKRNVRRLKELGDLRTKYKGHRHAQGNATMSSLDAESSGKKVALLKNVSKSFGERVIINDLSLKLMRGERLGIVGPNGAGKTTLLKMIIGELAPDSGTIDLGVGLEPLIIDQKRESLNPEWTLSDAMTDGGGDLVTVGDKSVHVMRYMKDFLFLPEQARTPIHVLSGGERGRLQLARGLRLPSNILILDEPTNDLDLETLDLLQELIADYKGTVILISHDRDFLDRTVSRTLAYEGPGEWQTYAGGYSDMINQRGEGVKARKATAQASESKKTSAKTSAAKPAAKSAAKLSYKHKFRLESLPKEMAALEAKITTAEASLADANLFADNPDKYNKIVEELSAAQNDLAAKEDEWLELEMLKEDAH
ncbi:MAG: ATP-binding cassette domain-containing protein [Maricaulaceae bacterium]